MIGCSVSALWLHSVLSTVKQGPVLGPLGGGNAAGLLRAFSNSADVFAAGFNRVEQVSGWLRVFLQRRSVLTVYQLDEVPQQHMLHELAWLFPHQSQPD
jgi:hypothetical protein